jgi:N4-gp56 family major capsid protein
MVSTTLFNPSFGLTAKESGPRGQSTPMVPIVFKNELKTEPGDTVRLLYPFQIGGAAFGREANAHDSAVQMGFADQDVKIEEHRYSARTDFEDSALQKNFINHFLEATTQIQTAVGQMYEAAACMHLAGYAPTGTSTSTAYVDQASVPFDPKNIHVTFNAAGAGPTDYAYGTTNFRVMPTGAAAEENITSSHPMTLTQLMTALKNAQSVNQGFAPCADGNYVVLLHTTAYEQLLADADFKNVNVSQDASAKGAATNVAVTGRIAQWRKLRILECPLLPLGINSSTGNVISTVRRNVLLGAHALSMANGLKGGAPGDKGAPLEFIQESQHFGDITTLLSKWWCGFALNRWTDTRDTVNTNRQRSILLPCYGV